MPSAATTSTWAAGYIDRKGDMLLVHGIGRASGVEELQNVQIVAQDGVPIYVKDVAEVVINHEMRRGDRHRRRRARSPARAGIHADRGKQLRRHRQHSRQVSKASEKTFPKASRRKSFTTARNWWAT